MMADEKQLSAPMRRRDQRLRWESSDTNLESAAPRVDSRKVKFQDGCVFLAACSSGDREEVKNLLQRGADINTANVDGLTALHQACIDDNLDMVEFLVELGADVDVCDNEGWTPLHATASCAFTEIARYLIKQGANVAAVNNDGDLPYDIAENKEMENLLQEEMDRQGINADAARCEEEEQMLEDANAMLQDSSIKEQIHPKTGATPLHVAAAKGYLKVMKVLLRANVDINAEDVDGWTPLHASVHWGQEDACKVLIENFCDMMHKNHAGHTPFDLAEKDMRKLLEELRETQASMRDKQDVNSDIIISSGHGRTRRSSVTRMSGDQKQNVIQRNLDEERASMAAYNPIRENTGDLINSISSSNPDTNTSEDSETERKNEKNKQVSQQLPSQTPSSWTRPISLASSNPTVELRRQDNMPKIDEVSESDRPSSYPVKPSADLSYSSVPKTTSSLVISQSNNSTPITASTDVSKPMDKLSTLDSSTNTSSALSKQGNNLSITDKLANTQPSQLQERLLSRRPYSSTGSTISTTAYTPSTTTTMITSDAEGKPERNSYTFGQSYIGYKSNYGGRSGNYIPYYQTRRDSANAASTTSPSSTTTTTSSTPEISTSQKIEDRLSSLGESSRIRDRSSTSSLGGPSPSTSSSSVTISTNSVFRRSYEPPKRDEETETQRKARAKHARQTRRSTQGVSLDDIEKAEQVLKSNDASKVTKDSPENSSSSLSTMVTTASSSSSTTSTELDSNHLKSIPSASTATTTITTSSNSSTPVTSSLPSNSSTDGTREDRPVLSSSSFRRRATTDDKDKNDLSTTDTTSSLRSSHRRARNEIDTNSVTSDVSGSTDLTSNYVPRSQRNTSLLSSSDGGLNLASSSQGVSRSSSFRSSRLRNGDSTELSTPRITDDDSYKKDKEAEGGKEEKKELHAIRARRQRRERRSTGIVMDSEEDGDKSKETKPDEDKKDEALASSRYSSRYGSNSDVPSSERSQRPVSYSDFSRSTGSLDIDYKKKYEDEKVENTRLRKELEDTKSNLRKAKDELDAAIKQKDSARNAERDKRALERKISELEEEVKKYQQDAETLKADNSRLKEENGALIRVISKLSK